MSKTLPSRRLEGGNREFLGPFLYLENQGWPKILTFILRLWLLRFNRLAVFPVDWEHGFSLHPSLLPSLPFPKGLVFSYWTFILLIFISFLFIVDIVLWRLPSKGCDLEGFFGCFVGPSPSRKPVDGISPSLWSSKSNLRGQGKGEEKGKEREWDVLGLCWSSYPYFPTF